MECLYKADITPKEAWDMLSEDKEALLIDVRTESEWKFVGIPDLTSINKELKLKEWRTSFDMSINPNFYEELDNEVLDKNSRLLFLCRTGGRSAEAATLMTDHGFENCYNVKFGFEGDLDENFHRGNKNGWKANHLPWRQG